MKQDNTSLSPKEMAHYARHIALPAFGLQGQHKLKAGKVLVIGAGGLGSPLLFYLAAAGVGTIGIVDDDTVDISNLQRQVLFSVQDVGKSKAQTAQARLLALNPHILINVYPQRITRENALELVRQYDIVADGSDNFPTRYLVNDACVLAGKVNVFASVFQFEGQVSVFNYPHADGSRGPNYRDLFPAPPPPDMVPNCAEGGVLGVLPGIIGSMQANEVIKILTGLGEPLAGKLFLFDAVSFTTRMLKIQKNPSTSIHGLIDYEYFCGMSADKIIQSMKELTVQELDELVRQHADFQLVDVREPFEHAISNIGGDLIPLGQIISSSHKFSRDKKVVVYCRSGRRSADAIRELEKRFGYKNLYNLKGGILAWSKEIDHKKKGQSSKRAAENAPNGCLIKKILSLPKSVFRYFFKDGSRR